MFDFLRLCACVSLAGLMVGCGQVTTQTLEGQRYQLSTVYHEPPRSLDSRALDQKAHDLCPVGVTVLSKQADRAGPLGQDDVTCLSGQCDFRLTWEVMCTDIEPQATSIFGET